MFLKEQQTPWTAIKFVIGEIAYGGRVTDTWDRRTIAAILDCYLTPKILDSSYQFSESGIYKAPSEQDVGEVKRYIESLPFTEKPEVFGMHNNADVTYTYVLMQFSNLVGSKLKKLLECYLQSYSHNHVLL